MKCDNCDVVKVLSIDRHFGIFTRNYVEYIANIQYKNRKYHTIIIDFNDVKIMNYTEGYQQVNDKFKRMFDSFRIMSDAIIGRWFSGDEIVIVTLKDPLNVIEQLKKHCESFNLSFKILLISDKRIEDISL